MKSYLFSVAYILPSEIHAIILCLKDIERPLKGVIIYVSKKLSGQQAELNDLVADLGGDYKWQYDATCTHFIFQVRRQSDVNQIFVTLRSSDSGCKKHLSGFRSLVTRQYSAELVFLSLSVSYIMLVY